jgi:hypothetical protein
MPIRHARVLTYLKLTNLQDRIPSQLERHPDEGRNQTHDMRNMQTLNRQDAKNAKKKSTAERRTFS